MTNAIIIITTSALIGYATNLIALKMLFRPRKKILGIQAIMIKRKAALAQSIADLVIDRLLGERLSDVSGNTFIDSITNDLAQHIITDLSLDDSESEAAVALLKSFLNNLTNVASVSDNYKHNLKQTLIDNIIAISDDEIESVTLTIVANEFAMIERLGAVLGALIGAISLLGLS